MTHFYARSRAVSIIIAGLMLTGCATPAPNPPSPADKLIAQARAMQAAAATQTPTGAGSVGAAPGGLKPFVEIIKDAQRIDGLFPVWRKDEKVWIELAPEQFGRPYLLAYSRTRGLGERGLYGNWLLDEHVVMFERVGNLVQMIASNERFTAPAGTPLAAALRSSFTDSLLGVTGVVSAPHPERKTVLVDASGLFLTDLPSLTPRLEAAYRLAYAFDARNSSFGRVRATPDLTTFEVKALYAIPRLPAPPAGPVPPGTQVPTVPRNLADGRSMFIGYLYSLATLPDPLMRARPADDRVGHFVTERWDFGEDTALRTRRHVVNRWRLDKKDPAAHLSEPVKPIAFWLDRNIPERYRETVKQGVLEWNKAFEHLGFKDAIRVEMQPENTDYDLADVRHASIRWYLDNDDGALAIGPSHVDPRTGEILDADIAVSDNWARLPRRVAVEQMPPPVVAHDDHACSYASAALDDAAFALDLLEARGEIAPGSPEAEAIVLAMLKDVVTHEVGHTLGLRHNFRASTVTPLAKLQDKAYTREHGLSGSVMDYNAFNIAREGEPQGEFAMSGLGPYDYWAIEYAYRPLAPQDEADGLARIAARSSEPALAYGTDEEYAGSHGYDPQVNQRDLGDDPLGYARRRIVLSNELWRRLQNKTLHSGESYAVLRRNVESGLRQFGTAADIAARHIGGVVYVRDHAGSPRASFTPVPAARQREALALLAGEVFAADALRFKPGFVARLTDDRLDHARELPAVPALTQGVFNLHKAVLDRVLSDAVAQRLLETSAQAARPADVLSVAELNAALRATIWSELRTGTDIPLVRRNLQREHLRRLAALLLKPSAGTPADARAIARENAIALAAELRRPAKAPKRSAEARAHLAESLATLEEALRAPMVRAGA